LERENGKEISLTCYSLSSLLKEFNLATVSEFIPREKLLLDRLWKKESALSILRKKCRQNLKFVSDVEGNTLME
jgi:hypothetical protein